MRGTISKVGAERQAPNGYVYVKVQDRGWILKHWLVAEKKLGRQINPDEERVYFIDKDKTNFSPDNIGVAPKKAGSLKKRLARLEAQRAELDAQIEILKAEIAEQEAKNPSSTSSMNALV